MFTITPGGFVIPFSEVAARASRKDHWAFDTLYETHKHRLCRRLMALVGDKEAAYDLYQETFCRIWKYFTKRAEVPQDITLHFEPWLYRIAKNIALDHLRHESLLTFLSLPDDETDDPSDYALAGRLSVNGHEEQICDMLCLKQILSAMSPQYRTCLVLYAGFGLSQREIAAELDISEKAVSSNVSRGYKQLRALRQASLGSGYAYSGVGISPAQINPLYELVMFPRGLSPRILQLWQEEARMGRQ